MPRRPLRVLIVDDEPLARKRVRTLLRGDAEVEVIGECGNGKDAAATIQKDSPDLVLLDIQMPEMSGFDVIAAVREHEPHPAIVFVTAHDKYALRAFEVHAIDYLLKPFDEERFRRALGRAKEQVRRGDDDEAQKKLLALVESLRAPEAAKKGTRSVDRLMVKSGGRVFFLKTADVDWIEAAGNYAKLHVGKDEHLIRETMNDLEGKLDGDRFVRIHRSTLVNLDRIKEMHPWFSGDYAVILADGTQLRLSRGYREKVQAVLGNPL